MAATIELDVIPHTERWLAVLPEVERAAGLLCTEVLAFTGITAHISQIELSLTLADDAHIRVLNNEYRHKDKPTNVLSFPNIAITPPHFDQVEHYNGYALLGDIVMSLDTLEREAVEQGKTLEAHFSHLLVHGVLHLLGYDHETEAEAEVMEALESEILRTKGIRCPYTQTA